MADLSSISTKEFAAIFRVESQTVRRSYCVNGSYMGIKPLKLPNGRLLWPYMAVQKLLAPDSATHNQATEVA